MEPVDNDVDIFTNEEVNKGDGEDNNKVVYGTSLLLLIILLL